MAAVCLVLSAISFAIAMPLAWAMVRVGRRLGQLDQPMAGGQPHKAHDRPVPNTGGVAIFAAVVLPLLAGLLAAWAAPPSVWQTYLPAAAEHIPGIRQQTPLAMAILASVAVLHVIGLIDDRRHLGPGIKLIAQLLVAAVLAGLFDVRIFSFLGELGPIGALGSVTLSVLWIVAIVNAMNMLDNMDGLAGGVGAIAAAVYLAATLIGGQWFVAAAAAILLGSLVGFLVHNVPPARLFMGDSGSMIVGLMLAVISIRTTYFDPHAPGPAAGNWHSLLMPLVVLAVPIYDLVSVCVVRIYQGKSPFRGDLNHFSHRLVARGLSRRAAVAVIWLITLTTALGGITLTHATAWQAILIATQTLAILTLLATLESRTTK